MTADGGNGIQAVRIRKPTDAASGDASQTPAYVVFAPQFHLLRDEQAQEGPADIAKAYDREVIGRNSWPPFVVAANRISAKSRVKKYT